jgi:hypothetical protein
LPRPLSPITANFTELAEFGSVNVAGARPAIGTGSTAASGAGGMGAPGLHACSVSAQSPMHAS